MYFYFLKLRKKKLIGDIKVNNNLFNVRCWNIMYCKNIFLVKVYKGNLMFIVYILNSFWKIFVIFGFNKRWKMKNYKKKMFRNWCLIMNNGIILWVIFKYVWVVVYSNINIFVCFVFKFKYSEIRKLWEFIFFSFIKFFFSFDFLVFLIFLFINCWIKWKLK